MERQRVILLILAIIGLGIMLSGCVMNAPSPQPSQINISGTWVGTYANANKPFTLILVQNGTQLSGTFTAQNSIFQNTPIYNGHISGNHVSFSLYYYDQQGNEYRWDFSGTVVNSGTTIIGNNINLYLNGGFRAAIGTWTATLQ